VTLDCERWECDGQRTQSSVLSLITDSICDSGQTNLDVKSYEQFYGKQKFNHTNLIQSWKNIFRQMFISSVSPEYYTFTMQEYSRFIWQLRIRRLGWWTKQWIERWEGRL